MSQADGALRLAELLAARLCHDFAGPLGSLAGAVEVAADGPDDAADALSIASDSAAALGARVRLYRAAWGGDCGPLTKAEILRLTAGHAARRVELDATGLADDFPGPVGRVVLNLVLLGMEAVSGGGSLSLGGTLGSGIMALPRGPRAGWPPGFADSLTGAVTLPASPREVQGPLTVMLARAAGLRLSLPTAGGGQPAPLLLSAP